MPPVRGGLRVEVRHQARAKIIHRAAERCLCSNPASSLPPRWKGPGRLRCCGCDGRGARGCAGLGGLRGAPWAPPRQRHRARGGARPLPVAEPLTLPGAVAAMCPCLPEADGLQMNPGRRAAVFSRQSADSGGGGKSAARSAREEQRCPSPAPALPAGNRCQAGGSRIQRVWEG